MASLATQFRAILALFCVSLLVVSCGGSNDSPAGPADATLSSLTLSAGTLSPVFSPSHSGYFVTVDSSVSTFQVTAVTSRNAATMTVNGVATTSGTASSAMNLVFGANTLDIVVTAEDGVTSKTYRLTVDRGTVDAALSALTINAGTLSPAFSPSQTDYSLAVNWAVTNVQITATAASSFATLTVDGTSTPSGASSSAIPLSVGVNTVDIVVTAGDGVTTKTYHLTITRNLVDASLSALTLSAGTLSPAFSALQSDYTTTVAPSLTSMQITVTAANSGSMLTVNGTSTASGIASSPIALAVGTNLITIVVTAPDGFTTQTYNISVSRPSSDATLTALALGAGTLSPAFFSGTTAYTATVGAAVASLQVTARTNSGAATMTVNSVATPSGVASSPIALAVGDNSISIVVTAQDGVTTRTYNVTVTRPSTDATLSALTLSSGVLSPTFASSQTNYSVTVTSALSAIQVTATTNRGAATMTVAGIATASGAASVPISLSVGDNPIAIVVTAQDGVTTKTYNVTVTRPSTDATLSALTLSSGALSPTFSSAQTAYSTLVPSAVASIQVTATTNNGAATMTINGTASASGAASAPISLTLGVNHIGVVVTAQDGVTTKTYDITVGRGDPDASLSALTSSTGTLNPAFSPTQTSYAVALASTVTSIQLTPTSTSGVATITVSGAPTNSGSASSAISLVMGNNPIDVVVTAQDGITTQTYSVNIVRGSTDATLSALTLSTGTQSPAFSPTQTSYSVQLASTVTSIQLTATTTSNASTVTVNGVSTTSGAASSAIPLTLGVNNIDVVVTAQDGVTIQTYSLAVIRGSIDATLSALTPSTGALSPAFSSAQTSYSVQLASTVTSIQVTATTSSGAATMTVNGAPTTSGNASSAIPLTLGVNSVGIVVTAEDGITTKTYTVTVIRGSIDATLSALTLSTGTLSPAFSSGTTAYTVTVGSGVASIQVTATTNSGAATMTVNTVPTTSGAAASVSLAVGNNPISIVVTAEDGVTTKTYNVTVTRPSNDATLSALTLSSGTLSPAFLSGTTAYAVTVGSAVTSVQVTATTNDGAATMTVNTVPTTSGAAVSVSLAAGDNPISIVVTAQDGVTTKTYNVTVTRPSTDATLSALTLSSGTLSPTFLAGQTSYSATVGSGVASIQVTATTSSGAATVTVNGTPTTSGSASSPISLNFGTNLVTIDLTAQDGVTTKSYTISVNRPSNDATLTGLTLSAGTLDQAFFSGTTAYTTTLDTAVASIQVTATASSGAATMTVNGTSVTSGAASPAISLTMGSNVVSVVVTAEDGVTTKTYNITVGRGTADATLSALTVTAGALSPAFSATQTSYTDLVGSAVPSIQVTATSNSGIATLTINGSAVASGTPSAIALTMGVNTINVSVTAQDGVTTQAYTITVARGSAVATLSALSMSATTLDQAFQSAQLSYTASVPYLQPATTVTATTTDANATLKIDNVAATSGSASGVINLAQGSNNISVVVTAQNAFTTQTYTIAVTRSPFNANVVTIAGTAGATGTTDGAGAAARFNNPTGITTDRTNLYVSDTDNHTIRKIVISSGVVTTIAGNGVSGFVDTPNGTPQFSFPSGITTDGTNLFVTDTGNHVIRHIDIATGTVTTFSGTGTPGSLNGVQSVAQFNAPSGIAIATPGTTTYLYVADTLNNLIRQVTVATGGVATFAGTAGAPGTADGTMTNARFNNPYGITTDGINLYVADTLNHSIRQIVLSTGVVTTLAGSSGVSGYLDGTGAAARFNQPVGITTDGENLYVADQQNHRIRKVVIATGVVTTLAGSGNPGSLDGAGTAAEFNLPDGLTNDGIKLYTTDFNHVVREIN